MTGLTAGVTPSLFGEGTRRAKRRGRALAVSEGEGVAQEPVDTETDRPADGHLVQLSRDGDRTAFEVLVRRYAGRLYAVVLRFVASTDEAEEVTQEAFLRAWRSIGRFEGRSQFFTWLYRIGINEAKRRAERRPAPGQVRSIEERPVDDTVDLREAPAENTEQAELRRALERAVRALPLKYRGPLILRDVEGLSTREAAEILELGEAAFKSRLHRARMAVREAIDGHVGDLP